MTSQLFKRITAVSLLSFVLFDNSISLALEYHGYFRSGMGASKKDTDQVCFKGAATEGYAKLRLGNECETYLEMQFADEYRAGRSMSDPFFKAYVRMAYRTMGEHDWESDDLVKTIDTTAASGSAVGKDDIFINKEATFAVREAYAEGSNLWGPSATKLWAGKRFYRRRDLYMVDQYIYENNGTGAGMEDLNLFDVTKMHFAIMRNIPYNPALPKENDGPAQTNFDLRFSDLALGSYGKLETILIYGKSATAGSRTGEERWAGLNGWQLGLVHELEDVFGGKNMLALQYGRRLYGAAGAATTQGAAASNYGQSMISQYGGYGTQSIEKDDDAAIDALNKSSTFRISEDLVTQPITDLSLGFLAFYQILDFGGRKVTVGNGSELTAPKKSELTFGVRPIYHFTDTLGLAVEAGLSQVKNGVIRQNDEGDIVFANTSFQKLTIAPQVTPTREYWAYGRPQLRLFYTKVKWDDNSKGLVAQSPVTNGVYADATSGWSAGAQVEIWW